MNTQPSKEKARERFEKSVSKGFVRNVTEQNYFWDFLDSLIDDLANEVYKKDIKDGEGTKNGMKRYRMGYEDGKRESIEEVEKVVKESDIHSFSDGHNYGAEILREIILKTLRSSRDTSQTQQGVSEKKVKVWFVDMPGWKIGRRYFSGRAFNYQLRGYPTKELALKAWPDEKPIQATLTYMPNTQENIRKEIENEIIAFSRGEGGPGETVTYLTATFKTYVASAIREERLMWLGFVTGLLNELANTPLGQRGNGWHQLLKVKHELWKVLEIGRLEGGEKGSVHENIGALRQWLNEDRITDPSNSKMVTNEELLSWLIPQREQETN